MYNMFKSQKTDMSESKIFPNRNYITMKNKKLKNRRNLQENVIHDYVIILCNYSCSNLIVLNVLEPF